MGGDVTCKCKPREVMVVNRKGRCSAFDGYHPMHSDYSAVKCLHCGHIWRSKAAWVDHMPTAPAGWAGLGGANGSELIEIRDMLKADGRHQFGKAVSRDA
ncbi:MAG: hypothetical protein COA96_16900 [SAR86 cluster bacterium]|uniref:Uncharacterized protein n=1 Tax=SAR86 cluster bacterium TaxID=2030880 RepID=A0A2A5AG40_9GAMM|nr:MAG: hypothetical protein COA96_16900 [SAR86 cluster bacterium]